MTGILAVTNVTLLGSPEIRRGGELVSVDTRKAIGVLAYLATAGAPVSRDVLCLVFWPESTQARARGALRRTLSSLRSAVGSRAVLADRESVQLRRGELSIDVVEFTESIAGGTHAALERAADLYRGDFLAGFTVRGCPDFEDWQRVESERLRREADGVLAALVEVAASRGDHATAIELAERRLDLDRLNEPAHRMLLLAEAWAGRRSRAIDRYRDAVRVLEDELGVAPLPETTELYEAVRRGEIPDLPRKAATLSSGGAPSAPPPGSDGPFVGRDTELDVLVDGYRDAAFGGRLIVVEGKAGIGKTRLAGEMMSIAETGGGRVALTRCHPGETELPYAPLTEMLRDLIAQHEGPFTPVDASRDAIGALLPEFAVGSGPFSLPGEGAEARVRFFEALRNAIAVLSAGDRPSLLVIDDLHLADRATIEFVAYLARRIANVPILLLVTWRRDEMPKDGPFPVLVGAMTRAGTARTVRLERLADRDIGRIVGHLMTAAPGSVVHRAITKRSEGVPLFAVEYARAFRERGTVEEDMPEPIRGLFAARLARVEGVTDQVLAAAAVVGRAFTPDLIREVSGRREDEVADALDELEVMALIGRDASAGSTTYDFIHDQLREVAHERVGAGRRRLLHKRSADALSSSQRLSSAGVGEAARHAEMAGDPDRAAGLYESAGRLARSVYANAEAAEYFAAALKLGYSNPASLREALGDLATLDGDYRRGREEYEGAAALVPADDLVRIEHKLGRLYYRRGDWQAAESYLNAALDQSPAGVLRVEVLADLATNAHRWGNGARARKLAAEALVLANEIGDGRATSRAANVSGLLARAGGDLDGAVALLEKSNSLARAGRDDEMQIAALNNLARVHAELGDHSTTVSLLGEALAKSREIGDRHKEAALLSNLGDAQFALGLSEEAAVSVKRSVVIMIEVGTEGENLLPEVWKLTEW